MQPRALKLESSAMDAAQGTAAGDPRYQKGTLRYTKASLMVLFFYLLWGDFAFQLMETVAPAIMPLQLKELGASNTMMGIILSTIPAFLNFSMNPIVSFRSDNLRTAWGRRKPYLMVATPFVTLFLVLLPYTPEIGRYLHGTGGLSWLNLAPNTVMISTMALVYLLFQFANYC
ncbi:MAG: MFS transporter, partial [Phycisphaerae bacterium]